MWPWQHWALHRAIIRSRRTWAWGEVAECWVCGKTWTAKGKGDALYLEPGRRSR